MFIYNVVPILIAICVFFGSPIASFKDVHQHFRKVADSIKVQTETHEVIFALKKDNLELLERALEEVSDPFHASYGRHWTKDEIMQYTNTQHRYNKLSAYLVQQGFSISPQSTCCDYITAAGSIRQWNTFFKTTFHEYRAVSPAFPLSYRQRKHYRSDSSFTIPKEIFSDIEHVFHVAEFPPPVASSLIVHDVDEALMTSSTNANVVPTPTTPSLRGRSTTKTSISSSSVSEQWIGVVNGYTTPALLNQLYDIRSNIGNNLTNQCTYQAGSWFSGADLMKFQGYFSLPQENITTDIGQTQNDTLCRLNEGVCAEANLDIQYIMAIAQHVPTIAYEWGDGLGQVDPWLAWILEVSNMTAPPDVISISYISYEDQFDAAYAKSFTTEALLLSLQGVTILAAAGDDGVSGYFVKKGTKSCGYYPMFPATCPYVTAIGGTTGPEFGASEEVVCAAEAEKVFITTGGGFSNLYGRPSWQNSQVTTYLQRVTPPTGSGTSPFNASGRAYPDISVIGNNYLIVLNGKLVSVSGTSASCPVVAAMVSLINSERLAHNASKLGWINPLLYTESLASLFVKDVVRGNNSCTSVAGLCCGEGYPAAEGWDASVGQGVLNYTAFRQVALGLVDTQSMRTWHPSPRPSAVPTYTPSYVPTASPTTSSPSRAPTSATPTFVPTVHPTAHPTAMPSVTPTASPTTSTPTYTPTFVPSVFPSSMPSARPSISHSPSYTPTYTPTAVPTESPTAAPSTIQPTAIPTFTPTRRPTTSSPTMSPTYLYNTKQVTFQVSHSLAPLLLSSLSVYETWIADGTMATLMENITCSQLFNNSILPFVTGVVQCQAAAQTLTPISASAAPTPSPAPSPSPTFLPTTLMPTLTLTVIPTAAPSTEPTTAPTAPSAVPTMVPTVAPSTEQPTLAPSNGVTNVVDLRRSLSTVGGGGAASSPTTSFLRHRHRHHHHHRQLTSQEQILMYSCTVYVRVALQTLLTYLPADTPLLVLLSNTTDDASMAAVLEAQLPSILANMSALSMKTSGMSSINQAVLTSLTEWNATLFGSVSSLHFASIVSNAVQVDYLPIYAPPSRRPTRNPASLPPSNDLSSSSSANTLLAGRILIIVVVVSSAIIVLMCSLVLYTCCCYEPPYEDLDDKFDAEDEKHRQQRLAEARAVVERHRKNGGSEGGGRRHHHHHHRHHHNPSRGAVGDATQMTEEQEVAAAIAAVEEAERREQRRRRRTRGMHPLLRSSLLPLTTNMTEEQRASLEAQRQAYIEYQKQRRSTKIQEREQRREAQRAAKEAKRSRGTRVTPSAGATGGGGSGSGNATGDGRSGASATNGGTGGANGDRRGQHRQHHHRQQQHRHRRDGAAATATAAPTAVAVAQPLSVIPTGNSNEPLVF